MVLCLKVISNLIHAQMVIAYDVHHAQWRLEPDVSWQPPQTTSEILAMNLPHNPTSVSEKPYKHTIRGLLGRLVLFQPAHFGKQIA